MYNNDLSATPPNDVNSKIWRYMDISKLLSLLEEEKLYFNRANNFEDPSEGKYPPPNQEILKNWIDGGQDVNKKRWSYLLKSGNTVIRSTVGINCWHINKHESMAMWKLYSMKDQGIAITSTYIKLKDSIEDKKPI